MPIKQSIVTGLEQNFFANINYKVMTVKNNPWYIYVYFNMFLLELKEYQIKEPPMKEMEIIPFVEQYRSNRRDMIGLVSHSVGDSALKVPEGVTIDRTNIELGQLIGSGHFGIVYKAEMKLSDGKVDHIAVKTLRKEFTFEDKSKVGLTLHLTSVFDAPIQFLDAKRPTPITSLSEIELG